MNGHPLAAFVLWTVLVKYVNVNAIGPNGSSVGFSLINSAFHEFTGVHFWLYGLTDWLGLAPFAFVLGFAVLGLVQWMKRKKLCKVDFSIFVLGGFYIITMAQYVLFEYVVINYRPVLIAGMLEASYPSSTTLLVLGVMPTLIEQICRRCKATALKATITILTIGFSVFMVVGRLISGVHWFTDILGSVIISVGLFHLYKGFVLMFSKKV